MLVPVSWLKDYVELTLPVADLAHRLTMAGLGVDAIHQSGDWWDPDFIRVGLVVQVSPHPDADRLVLVDVDFGAGQPLRVVTGAPNLYAFKGAPTLPILKVAFARAGAVLVDAYSEERPRPKKKLKTGKIRGVESAGMVCSERELGLSEEHEGIILLPEDAPVGMPLRDYLGDQVLELDLTPDMARCLSLIGVAREVAALTGVPLRLPPDRVETAGAGNAADYFSVRIDEPALCNRYTGMLITNVTIGLSPAWMQERLTKAGMRPINNVVDITNYVMLELGQPLHAFDYDVLVERAKRVGDGLPAIIVRRAEPGEKFTTLDHVERTLPGGALLIADNAGAVAIGGVMGGLESEVGETTRTILLESATFDGINNRTTCRALSLFSEASSRFTKGVPAALAPIAARRAAELMRRYAGGTVTPGMVDVYPVPQQLPMIYTTASDMARLLGMELSLAQIADALQQLDFAVTVVPGPAVDAPADALFALQREPGEPLVEAVAPWHRLDVRIPADLCEEVARMVGYEHVATTLMRDELPTQRRMPLQETEERIRDILLNCGLQDTINYALSSRENHARLLPGVGQETPFVTIANPIAPERSILRRALVVSALENLQRNLRFTDRMAVFELGRAFLPEAGDGVLPLESRRLCITLVGPRRPASFYSSEADAETMDFYDLKGIVEVLCERLGFKAAEVELRANPDTGTFGPRCADIWLQGKRIGRLGEVHPLVRREFDLPAVRINIAEMEVEPLVLPQWRLDPMRPISSYPPVVEDLAFVVGEEVTNRQIEALLRTTGGELLADVELFDLYRGANLPEGSKSLAYRLTWQSNDSVLKDSDVAKLREKVIRRVERETGGKLRA